MFKHILISTDFSDGSPLVISRALQLARQCGAHVDLVHVVTNVQESLHRDFLDRGNQMLWEADLEAKLDLVLPDNSFPGARKYLLWGKSVAHEIVKHASQENCDLIVCGTHGRGVFTRALFGSVPQELIRNSKTPVLVIPPNEKIDFTNGIKRVLVAIDFSLLSKDVLAFAAMLAASSKATIVLFHAIDEPILAGRMDVYPAITMSVSANEELRKNTVVRLNQMVQENPVTCSVETEATFGDPADAILSYSEHDDCTCIVMSPHVRNRLERVILGSVTGAVLSQTILPVFTVAPRSDL